MKLNTESKIWAIGSCFAGFLAASPAQAASFGFGHGRATVDLTGDHILGDNFNVIDPVEATEPGVFSEAASTDNSISTGPYRYADSSGSWTHLGSIETITRGDNPGGAISGGTYDIWSPRAGIGSALGGMPATGPGDPTYPWPAPVFGAGTLRAAEVSPSLLDGASTLMLLGIGFGALAGLSRRWRRA